MARQRTPVTVNQFVGGLNTEASPLNFPPEFTSDEQNMRIRADGSRSRRQGLDVEVGFTARTTGVTVNHSQTLGRSQFVWENAGGDPTKMYMVVQIGNYLAVHLIGENALSSAVAFSKTFPSATYTATFSYASVDGSLIIVTGQKQVTILSDNNGTVSESGEKLLVRDLWGVEATISSVTLTDPQNSQTRPASLNNAHTYNLRNQTFALPYPTDTGDNDLRDRITNFHDNTPSGSQVYPSNSDSAIPYIFADPNNSSSRTLERYSGLNHAKTPPSTALAPIGYFIIDALDRGTSRVAQDLKLRNNNSALTHTVSSLPADSTSNGPKVVAEYTGRAWFAGFDGAVTDGDARSPDLSSYVMFSQFVEDQSQVPLCYQEADPTSHVDPNLVDTDGGFIKISGAYNIQALVPLGNSLFVVAENGVWRILGSDGDSFRPTAFSVEKLYDEGTVAGGSVVLADNAIVFWGLSSIFAISQDQQFGQWSVSDITETSIQSLYNSIPSSAKAVCNGHYDSESNVIRWLYDENPALRGEVEELVLNTKFRAFTRNKTTTVGSNILGISSAVSVRPESPLTASIAQLTVNGTQVQVNGVDVIVTTNVGAETEEVPVYCVITGQTSAQTTTFHYTFGSTTTISHQDWGEIGTPTSTPAYLETGSITTGEPRLRKDVPYVTTFFERVDGSSCQFQAKWNRTDSFTSYKWSNPREIYRPNSRSDGQTFVTTRSKARGSGNAVSLRFENNGTGEMHLYGWAFNLQATTEE